MGRMRTPAGAAGRVAWMMAECRPGAGSLVAVMVMLVNPAASRMAAVAGGGEGAGGAAGQPLGLGSPGRVQVLVGDDVADADAAAGAQHAEGLGQDAGLVGGQVDDAVGDDNVDAGFGQRDGLDAAGQELGVGHPGGRGVVAGQGDHVGRAVQAVSLPAGGDAAGRQQHVDAAARAQVQHRLAGVQRGDGDRVAAAQAGPQRAVGQVAGVVVSGGAEAPGLERRRARSR